MLCKSYIFIFLACLSDWCAATLLEVDLPELPEITPITELPPGMPTCVGRKADINECLKNALNELRPRLKQGIPELSIPQADPLVIDLYSIEVVNDVGEGHLDIHHLITHGISESIVQNVNMVIDGAHVKLQLLTTSPNIQKAGTFQGELATEGMDLKPHGNFSGNITDLVLNIQLEGDLSVRDGHKYLTMTAIDVYGDIGDVTFEADNTVPNEKLNKIILDVINDHWRSLHKVILKETRDTWVPIALNISNSYFNAIPFDLFFDTS